MGTANPTSTSSSSASSRSTSTAASTTAPSTGSRVTPVMPSSTSTATAASTTTSTVAETSSSSSGANEITVDCEPARLDATSTPRQQPPRPVGGMGSARESFASSEWDDGHASSSPRYSNHKKRSWWDRVVSFRSKSKREAEEELIVDQDLYMRTILESYSSSLSSNRISSVYPPSLRSGSSRRAYMDPDGGIYVAQPETPQRGGGAYDDDGMVEEIEEEEVIMEDVDEKAQRRINRRVTQDAIRAKLLRRDQHRARTRRKLFIFAAVIGLTLTAFIAAALVIANVGVKARTEANNQQSGTNNETTSTTTTTTDTTPTGPTGMDETPSPWSSGDGKEDVDDHKEEKAHLSDLEPPLANITLDGSSSTVPGLTGRSGLDFITPQPQVLGESVSDESTNNAGMYMHCVLMSLSLWMSLVVIGMHMTFRSFRTYSMSFVLELSCVQCGYWITALVRVQVINAHTSDTVSLVLCLAECLFNFGQISFTCAIAFSMYRSVVSYADALLDTQSASKRYRSYSINVMLLSLLASITLALVGYQRQEAGSLGKFETCLYPTCRLILYVYYPLLAFGFNFIFYLRFKRTIGGAYPMSATGRLNKVARSYLVLFFVCWGSLITLTALRPPNSDVTLTGIYLALQYIFDVLGVGTALITLTNFHRCRKAFDFGLSLKAIDPHSIEFEEPLQILGEGTFAIVLRAKWHQRTLESNDAHTVDIAVKTFKHTQFETLEHMKEEAYLASKLVHPCVMMTYGCYTIGNNLYIVSEYLGGGTLQTLIDANTSFTYERALQYAHMIAMGMRFLHGLPIPIIHRDLKPLNCIFDSEQEMLKLADFGESKLFRKEGMVSQKPNFFPSVDLTLQMTTNIGSACWAAPEVLKDENQSEYSLKIDVYSFGIICWQLFTCKVPYTDIPGSVLAVAEAVIAGTRPEIPSKCPTLFAKIMRRCWHEDPLRRPTFEDIVQLLEMELCDVRAKEADPSRESDPETLAQARQRIQFGSSK